jgi:Ca2+-dependent lipid-binding protein
MGSFFQFLGRPAAKIEVEPVVGEESSINLKSLPRVTTIITDLVNKEIDNLCFPGSLKMDIPCTTEGTEIDKNGVPIKKAKQFNVLEQND